MIAYKSASTVVLMLTYRTLHLVFNRHVFWIVGTKVYQHSILSRRHTTEAVRTCQTTIFCIILLKNITVSLGQQKYILHISPEKITDSRYIQLKHDRVVSNIKDPGKQSANLYQKMFPWPECWHKMVPTPDFNSVKLINSKKPRCR